MSGNFSIRQAAERAAAIELMTSAHVRGEAIRKRLAAVASDLRAAANDAGVCSENLLDIANRLERQSQAGENV